MAEIYGEKFMNKLMSGIKQKKYRGKNEKQTEDDKLKQHLTSLLIGAKKGMVFDDDEDPHHGAPE